MKIENGISLRTFWLFQSCGWLLKVSRLSRKDFDVNKLYPLFPSFLKFPQNHKPRKSQINCLICFQIARYSSVFQRISHLQFFLAWLFSGMLFGALCLGFEGKESSALHPVRLPMLQVHPPPSPSGKALVLSSFTETQSPLPRLVVILIF